MDCLTLIYLHIYFLFLGGQRRPPLQHLIQFLQMFLFLHHNLRHFHKCPFLLFYFPYFLNYLCVCVCVCVCVCTATVLSAIFFIFYISSFVFGHGAPCPYKLNFTILFYYKLFFCAIDF